MSFRLGQIRNVIVLTGFRLLKVWSVTLIVAMHVLLHTVLAIVAVERESQRMLGEVTFPRSRACGIRVEWFGEFSRYDDY